MATIQLGAIVTKIAGSIGGTNFRRNRATTVMSNKTSGGSKNKLKQNKALPVLSGIIKGWSLLSQSVRDTWNTQATNFQFPDKFGNLRNLTGRQLYIKLQTQAQFSGQSVVDPNVLDSNVMVLPNYSVELYAGGLFNITFESVVNNSTLQISGEFLKNSAISPTFKRRKILSNVAFNGGSSYDVDGLFSNQFPFLVVGDKMRVYFRVVNSSGFKSAWYYTETTVLVD